jgi:deoxyribonuclease V
MKRSLPSSNCRTNKRKRADDLPLPSMPDLNAALAELLKQIPAGRVTTYGALAEALGSKTAARWVGESLRDHRHTKNCVCHRVVRSDGSFGLFVTGNADEKKLLLLRENVSLSNGRVDLEKFGFHAFQSDRPLESLIEWQKHLAQRVRLTPLTTIPDLVAGIDVAYARPDRAVGAYVLFDIRSSSVVWSNVIEWSSPFPYIPGFLTFRELPVFVELLDAARSAGHAAAAIFVDGNGILHPRRAGIATSVGVIAGAPTVGVGKKLLCGGVQYRSSDPNNAGTVVHEGELIGTVVQATVSSRPIYVSPGHLLDVTGATDLTRLTFRGHRLPEPLFQADALSKKAARAIRSDRVQLSSATTNLL